ncbi:trihelix transcription factor ASIL2 [Cinnamomum micranthum f. kanehirae]|uniref:Trihelix transcription factor ASIL2 n=1 Tax=Cinnamomum micranthum f. kanehirae TaxID=337451 RepID=A0A443PZX2_9MAGN|nr:trihelix transcription factor ASIL2 [Cinnamomum micranthum f. kanehirae]
MDGRETALRRPSYHALPSREDCWSEGATSTLIDAWGDRYLDLNRGNLRQKHWQDVADAVNSRDGAGKKPRRTDVQCKNRIDTLKKKYKLEKAKIAAVPDGTVASQWPFFSRLDDLIGPAAALKKPSPPLALPLPYRKTPPPLPQAAAVRPSKDKRPAVAVDDSFFRRNYSAAAAAAAAAVDADSGSSRSSTESRRRVREEEDGGGGNGDGDGLHQLAQAIERFAEVYERVEDAKQRQLLELEKERMEFAKGLEFQRMQLFMDWQIQLEKVKRAKRSSAAAGEHNLLPSLPF